MRFARSSKRRPGSAFVHWCSFVCITSTRCAWVSTNGPAMPSSVRHLLRRSRRRMQSRRRLGPHLGHRLGDWGQFDEGDTGDGTQSSSAGDFFIKASPNSTANDRDRRPAPGFTQEPRRVRGSTFTVLIPARGERCDAVGRLVIDHLARPGSDTSLIAQAPHGLGSAGATAWFL